MKSFLSISVALLLLTACSEEQSQSQETESNALQQAEQIAVQRQQTPRSLTGDEAHRGPNPHAKLTPEQHISVASQHAEEGRMAEALDILTRAIMESPNDASLIGTRGSMLLSDNRVYEALVDLDKAITLAPDSAILLVNRSQAYRKFRRSEEAMTDLDNAISLSPRLIPARFNRGALLYDNAKYKEALADFDVCVEVAPETAGPYFNRAVTRDALGDQTGAVNDMNKFLELSDNPEWNKIAQETLTGWKNKSE